VDAGHDGTASHLRRRPAGGHDRAAGGGALINRYYLVTAARLPQARAALARNGTTRVNSPDVAHWRSSLDGALHLIHAWTTDAEHADPIGQLTTQEQQQASARATFVREDAMLLPLPNLVRRLVGVGAAGKERVDCYLWSRYARQRIVQEQEKREDAGRPLDPTTRAQLATLTKPFAALFSLLSLGNPA